MIQTASRTVPYEVYEREHTLRMQAEQDLDKAEQDLKTWKAKFYRLRDIRRAPVLQPMTKDVLEECLHVQEHGQVSDAEGRKRANFTTIAKHLKCDPKTVKRHAERLAALTLVDICEQQGIEDEFERKYIKVYPEKLRHLDKLTDPEHIVPKQGGDRFYTCMQPGCDGEMEVRKITTKRTRTLLRCVKCHHETELSDTGEVVDDTGWKRQDVQNRQETQNQLAQHCVYTPPLEDGPVAENPQNQVGFTASASHARSSSVLRSPPSFLRRRLIWCCWRWELNEKGKRTKVPYIADMLGTRKASVADDSTWRTHTVTLAVYEKSQQWSKPFDGIGFMCNGTFTFLDQDHCRNPETGEIDPTALERARAINSYTESSISGHGIHTYAEGTVLANRKHQGVEMYSTVRFCVYTGQSLDDFPQEVEPRQDELRALHTAYFPPKPEYLWNMAPEPEEQTPGDEELQQLLQDILAKASKAQNAKKFMDVWNGDFGEYYHHPNGEPDHSDADLGLCRMLVFFGEVRSVSTLDWLFRRSRLYRPKWERADYRNGTLMRALGQQERRAS